MAANTQDLTIYYKRWQALDKLIDTLVEHYESQNFPRKNTILYLLKSLKAFASGQFHFFYYGLDHDNSGRQEDKDPRLALSLEYPAETVLTGILEQIGHDLDLIQRAADQRLLGDKDVKDTLANADKLAWSAVKPAVDYAAIDEATTVLTYFHKSPVFYSIPYAQVALIAIPFTCISKANYRDYLAIPHEVGHYVFRHSIGEAKTAQDRLRDSYDDGCSDKYGKWIRGIFEETFADIYGCLIAGPVMALNFQDLSLANSQTKFRVGDGRHPNPVLRPYIYIHVLKNELILGKATNSDWGAISTQLAQRWEGLLKERGDKFSIKQAEDGNDGSQVIRTEEYGVESALGDFKTLRKKRDQKPLEKVVIAMTDDIINRILLYTESRTHDVPSLDLFGWGGPVGANTTVNNLYFNYEKNFDHLLAQIKLMPPDADPSSIRTSVEASKHYTTQLWLDWVKAKNPGIFEDGSKSLGEQVLQGIRQAIPKPFRPASQKIPEGEVKDPDKMEPGTWGYILFADGWTTDGPGPDMGHPGG